MHQHDSPQDQTVDPTTPVASDHTDDVVDLSPPRTDIALVAITVVSVLAGVALRFWPRSGMWLDEALTTNIAGLPLDQIGEALRRDGHPPLFYVLLHWWMAIGGESDDWVRALAGFISVLGLPLTYLGATRLASRTGAGPLGSRRTGLVAVAVMAVLPYGVRYAAEARMYSLAMTLVLGGYLLVDDLLSARTGHPRRILVGAATTVVAAALLWTHYWSMWLLAAVGLMAVWVALRSPDADRRSGARMLVGALVVGGLLFLPWLPSLLYQSAHTGTPWGERFGPASVVVVSIVDFAGARHGAAQLLSYVLVPLVLMAATVRIVAAAATAHPTVDGAGSPGGSQRSILVLTGSILPRIRSELSIMAMAMGLGWATAFASGNTFASRYAAVVYPLFVLCVAAGIAVVRSALAANLLLVAVVGLSVFGSIGEARYVRSQSDSIAEDIVEDIADNGVSRAVVIACPDQLGVALQRQLDRRLPEAPEIIAYPGAADPRFIDWVGYSGRNEDSDPVGFVEQLGERLPDDATVYVVSSTTYRTFEGKCEQLAAVLNQGRVGSQVQSSKPDDHEEPADLLVLRPAP